MNCFCCLDESSDRKLEEKSAYITMWGRDGGKKKEKEKCLHARLIVHLTVAAWRRARPVEQKVGRHHSFNDRLTLWQTQASSAHRPSLKRWEGGVKGYGWKKQQWWETVTAQWAWHVDWTHSVQPAHSSQATKWDPFLIHERQTSDSVPVKVLGIDVCTASHHHAAHK